MSPFQNVAFMIYSALCNSGTVDSLTNHSPITFQRVAEEFEMDQIALPEVL